MAVDLGTLQPALQEKVVQLLESCVRRGYEMRPSTGLRDPFEQAKLWRQSRSIEEINAKIMELEQKGAPFLADCIRSVGPRDGRHVTDTPPGFSWHQWGEALDCFWLVNAKAEWSTQKLLNGFNGYRVYADEADRAGLTPGGHWDRFEDWPHVQLRSDSNAGSVMSVQAIDKAMKTRFGK